MMLRRAYEVSLAILHIGADSGEQERKVDDFYSYNWKDQMRFINTVERSTLPICKKLRAHPTWNERKSRCLEQIALMKSKYPDRPRLLQSSWHGLRLGELAASAGYGDEWDFLQFDLSGTAHVTPRAITGANFVSELPHIVGAGWRFYFRSAEVVVRHARVQIPPHISEVLEISRISIFEHL